MFTKDKAEGEFCAGWEKAFQGCCSNQILLVVETDGNLGAQFELADVGVPFALLLGPKDEEEVRGELRL